MGKERLDGKLPLTLDGFPCPICGSPVVLGSVVEWGTDDGTIVGVEYECSTEPDLDSDEWPDWHAEHYRMPYVDWLPWETRMMRWLNWRYCYRAAGDEPKGDA